MRDIFNREKKELSQEKQDLLNDIKEVAENLYEIIHDSLVEHGANSHCINMAKAKLEEAIMWVENGLK